MRTLPLLALLAAALLAGPAAAQSSSALATTVAAGDAQQGQSLQFLSAASLGFFDSNGDGRANARAPQEPVYLDLDGSRSVTYGDLRLTPVLSYPAGSLVNASNADIGHALTATAGWFAQTAQGAWFVDADGSRTVSDGDVRLASPAGARVSGSDADARTPLEAAQGNVASASRVGFVDADSDGRRGATEPVVLDLDAAGASGAGRLSAGDVRLRVSGFGSDDSVSHAELQDALSKVGVTSQGGTYQAPPATPPPPAWGTPQLVLLALAAVNLVAVIYVFSLVRQQQRPRNPFK